jgi:hypothetical protein
LRFQILDLKRESWIWIKGSFVRHEPARYSDYSSAHLYFWFESHARGCRNMPDLKSYLES